ncbi:MAG TPA: NAD(P)-dependent oxidoreductase [Phycisphaerae bacterium]|nr:NAD(P)-dependent oxidoreductase [Phycisphaerae bacterium]
MKILVTGGAGYIGSTLVPTLLEAGHQVRALDCLMHGGRSLLPVWSHPRFEFHRGDVRDPSAVRTALEGIEAVVHLAAIVGDPACARQPELALQINRDASLKVLGESARAGVRRFVFASTCSNYGRMTDRSAYVDESSDLRPVSLYAETKVAVERAVLDPACTGDLCATALRFATVYGVSPRMRFDLTVNEFTLEVLTKKHLTVFGEQFWRPYIHVRDLARGIGLILQAPIEKVRNQAFNVGSTAQNYQKQQLVEMLRPLARDAVIEFVHKDEDPRDYRVSFEKIRRLLDFECRHSVEGGMNEIARLVQSGAIENYDSPEYRN